LSSLDESDFDEEHDSQNLSEDEEEQIGTSAYKDILAIALRERQWGRSIAKVEDFGE
jgi:hypothetical protein